MVLVLTHESRRALLAAAAACENSRPARTLPTPCSIPSLVWPRRYAVLPRRDVSVTGVESGHAPTHEDIAQISLAVVPERARHASTCQVFSGVKLDIGRHQLSASDTQTTTATDGAYSCKRRLDKHLLTLRPVLPSHSSTHAQLKPCTVPGKLCAPWSRAQHRPQSLFKRLHLNRRINHRACCGRIAVLASSISKTMSTLREGRQSLINGSIMSIPGQGRSRSKGPHVAHQVPHFRDCTSS